MKPIEISHIINAFLESSNIDGKCIIRKKVEHNKIVKSLITIYFAKSKQMCYNTPKR